MTIPANVTSVAIFIAFLLPGIVYAAVRATNAGYEAHDKDWSSRLLQALLVSIVLDAIYLLLFGPRLLAITSGGPSGTVLHARRAAIAVLVLGIAVPAAAAWIRHARLWVTRELDRDGRRHWQLRRGGRRHSTPTAWDRVAGNMTSRWVRVRVGDGKWVGGWFSDRSYLSNYPEARDLYIEVQYRMGEDGSFTERLENSAGVWPPGRRHRRVDQRTGHGGATMKIWPFKRRRRLIIGDHDDRRSRDDRGSTAVDHRPPPDSPPRGGSGVSPSNDGKR